jgi:uncharacterized membrane protein
MPELSNKTLPGGEMKELTFLETPIMSTYLVAFCVGEFDYVQAQTTHGVLVRVYTPPGKSETGLFALDCATKSLDAYNDFFGIKYPLPKLDMVRGESRVAFNLHYNAIFIAIYCIATGGDSRVCGWGYGKLGACYLSRGRFVD